VSYTLEFPIQYIPNPARSAAVGLGDLYIGVVDGDPAFEPSDRIQVYIARQNDSDLAIPQPIRLTAGGVPTYNGVPVTLKINQSFSVAVLDRNGAQVCYASKSGEIINEINNLETLVAGLEALVNSSVIESVSALSSTVATAGRLYGLKEYQIGTGKGGGTLIGATGPFTANGITVFAGASGTHFKRINYELPTPVLGGAKFDGTTNDSAAIKSAYALNKILPVEGAVVSGSTNIREVVDAVFVGDAGSDIYRKTPIKTLSRNVDLVSADVIAAKHIKWGCQVNKPTVMLIGDSIASYNANSITRADMLVECLREACDKQFPQGVNFFNRSIPGANYAALFSNASSPNIPWYTSNTVNWITDTYNTVQPDIVFIAFGMNDGSSLGFAQIKAAIDFYQSRSKPCSIVICTNLVPRIASVNVGAGTEQSAMNGRDYSAGLLRTYAKYRDVGVLDFHRALCRAQDGFDPVNTVFKSTPTISGAPFPDGKTIYVSPETCNDWVWGLRFDDSASGTLSVGIVIDFAGGFIQLTRSGSDLGIALYLDATLVFGSVIPVTFANTVDWNLTVERKNGRLIIYQRSTAPTWGAFMEPIFDQRIPYPGGTSVNSVRGVGLLAVDFRKGEYVTNTPSAYNSQLWNSETGDQGYGGSGFNHPSNWIASHVYRPVIDSTIFYTYVQKYAPNTGFVGETLTASLDSASAVTLTTNVNAQVLTIALPPGRWKLQGIAAYIPAGGVNVASLKQGTSTGGTSFDFFGSWNQQGDLGAITVDQAISVPDAIHNVINSPTTTVGLVCRAAFTVGTLKAYGYLSATRMVER